LSASQRRSRERALEAVSLMRRSDLSLSQAARRAGTRPETVRRYAGGALERRGATYRAKASDRALRRVAFLTPEGNQAVTVRSSRDASRVARYQNAVREYVRTGDASGLRQFEGGSVTDAEGKRWEFVTDRAHLRRLGHAGVLSFESIYASVA
jgi:hypothetical protein